MDLNGLRLRAVPLGFFVCLLAAAVCLFTTGFSLLGKVFRGRTAATAVSVFNFLIMLFTGILFFVSSFISLQVQLLVITITLFCSILGIFAVDNMVNNTETVSSSVQTE